MSRFIFILLLTVLAATGCRDDGPTPPAPAPVAAFTVGGTLQAGHAVVFDASGSTDPAGGGLSYSWSFGDGTHGGTAGIAHLYAQAGGYPVQLTIRDADGVTATQTQTVTVAPGPAPTGTATVSGLVTLADGTPLAGVSVAVAGTTISANTAVSGLATLAGVPAGVPLVLRLTRSGYADGLVRLDALPNGSSDGWFQAALAPRAATGTLASAQAGGTVAGGSGAQVIFAPAGLVHADGSPVTGAVDVAITPVDVANAIDAFPGPFTGVQAGGTSTPIASFGVMEVSVSQGGQALQVAPGSTATIDIPVYTGGSSLGQTVPLWSLDETAGTWVQEGTGTVVASAASPTGLALRGMVSHLSWWNMDIPYAPHTVNVQCFTLSGSGPPAPLTDPCYVRAVQESVANPRTSYTAVVPAGTRAAFPIFPGVSTRIHGTRPGGGTGHVLVSGTSGTSQNVDVILPPPGTTLPPPAGVVQLVVVGTAALAIAVTDGTTWSPRPSPLNGSPFSGGTTVAWDGNRWVAGGTGTPAVLANSPDGVTWTPGTVTAPSTLTAVHSIAGNGTTWVAVGASAGGGGVIVTSTDGTTWTETATMIGGPGKAVAWNGTYFLAVDAQGQTATATDGVAWDFNRPWVFNPNAFNPQPEMSALAWNGALWVAVLDNNGVGEIYTSFDGWTWTQEFVPGLPSLYSVAWNGSSWMAGSLSGVATSLNGQAWTYQPSAHHVNSLAWTGTEWVAAMGGSAVIRSANGTVWTVETVPLGGPSAAVAYRRPLFPPWP